MKKVFDSYGAYYDLFYRDKDYSAEVLYITKLLKKYSSKAVTLLEYGSGTGIHGSLLAKNGYRVTGVELSHQMAQKAIKCEGFKCIQGDIRSIQLGITFDAVLSLFHVMSYQTSNEDFLATLKSAASHLNTGGFFIFDIWYTPAVYAQKPEVRIKRIVEKNLKVMRIAEPVLYPNDNRVDVHYNIHIQDLSSDSYHEFNEVHPMRHFSIPEIDLFAKLAGFEKIHSEAFLTGENPGENSWGVCFVLKKV